MTLKVRENGSWVTVGGGGPAPGPGWQRPFDWLPLPEVEPEDRIFAALVAVYPHESNYLSFSFAGAYQVDWGDGSAVETFSSSAQAHHIYDYADVPGTECSRGYRQAVVTVTPTTATWTTINLNVRNSAIPANGGSNNILDVVVAGSTLSSVALRGGFTNSRMMEQFRQVGTWAVTNFSNMFFGCASLQSIPALDTSSGTSFSTMFYQCYSLQSIPELDTSNGEYFSDMFGICNSLQSIPALDTSNGMDFSGMFDSCTSLQSIPALDTSNGEYFSGMFGSCTSLQSIPALDTSNGMDFSWMFASCTSLQSIPALDTSSGTSFSSMFNSCVSLSDAPLNGTTRAISYTGTRLSRAALVRVLNGLGTASGAQTITITNTPGAATLTSPERAIATNKGWTISG